MKVFFLVVILLVCGVAGQAQAPQPDNGIPVPLRNDLDSSYYEYSGMAKWKNKVLLIPQYPDKWENSLFALDSTDIDRTINGKQKTAPYTRIVITNLANMRQQMHGTYQGFEGAVVVGNTIYFTLEFSEDTCYLLKGFIREKKGKITVDLFKIYPLLKPKDAYVNAGYESIGYLPGSQVLYVFFEKNSATQQSVALVDTSFGKDALLYGSFEQSMFFRLTDVAATGPHTFIGINHYYNDYHRKKKEYSYYVGDDNKTQASHQMFDADPAEHNYTAIVALIQKGMNTEWKTKKFISYGDENWEGLLPFKNGFLMVVDEYPKDKSPRMRYFEW